MDDIPTRKLTFDFQPLLIILFFLVIRRLENTQAIRYRGLLGMGIVFDLIQHAAHAKIGALPSQGGFLHRTCRGRTGCLWGTGRSTCTVEGLVGGEEMERLM